MVRFVNRPPVPRTVPATREVLSKYLLKKLITCAGKETHEGERREGTLSKERDPEDKQGSRRPQPRVLCRTSTPGRRHSMCRDGEARTSSVPMGKRTSSVPMRKRNEASVPGEGREGCRGVFGCPPL